jgi:pimeloyl-ACP methyl ester carboxylesterase
VDTSIKPFTIAIPQSQLDDLSARLANTRWPEAETVDDWSQGSPLSATQKLCGYWQQHYDWRRCEQQLNALDNYTTTLDGLDIHFIHMRSPHPNAMPLLLTHGWPGSVIEFMKVIGPLTDPVAHGGKAEDAFDVVIPALPGFGFSAKPSSTGWNLQRIATAWIELMKRLGYSRFVAQGGDWGAGVTTAIGAINPPECLAIHLNMPLVYPQPEDFAQLTEREQAAVDKMKNYQDFDSGYAKQQSTRPQSIGYGLVDSPAALAAWIYEKYYQWTDNNGTPEDALSTDEMLDNIMLYWLTASGASAARLYWESFSHMHGEPLQLPVGVSIFPEELFRPSRRWAERAYDNIIHWNELDKGGHFAAFEQPVAFSKEVRDCFRPLR